MRRQTPTLEWHVVENDEEWKRQQALLAPAVVAPTGYRRRLQRYAGNGIALFLLLVLVSVWWRHSFQAGMHREQGAAPVIAEPSLATAASAPAELVAAIADQQRDLAQLHQVESATGGISPTAQSADPAGTLDIRIHTVAIHGEQAVVGVILADQNGAPVYRQTRFYRRSTLADGQLSWQQTPPDALLWGPEQRLATPYFLYHFRQQDAAVIGAVAPVLDTLYTTLWRNLGLPISLTPNKLVIAVTIMQPPGQTPLAFEPQCSVSVPSPARYLAPVTLRDVDLLVQSLALPLLAHGLAQARADDQIGPAWQPLLDGLSLWQLWDLDLPLATWREPVVRWQYRDLPSSRLGETLPLPLRYQELCTAHQLWLRTPLQLHIPLMCAGRQQEEVQWQAWRAAAPLTHLAQLGAPSPLTGGEGISSIGPSFFTNHPGQTVALATLIDYAVDAYGRERLPALVAGLGDAESWDTLLPAVFGVSAAEFEAGWQAYLADQYGIVTKR